MSNTLTATVTLTFNCPTSDDLEAQRSKIEDDISRLYDADSTTGVACSGFTIDALQGGDPPDVSTRTHVICGRCGSEDVRSDAYASWDPDQGDWELHSVYADKTCEACEESTSLIDVDEATGLEVQAFGMIYCDDGARLVNGREQPEFYDLVVKTMAVGGGEILTLHEFDDMSRAEVEKCLADMAMLYPTAPVSCFFGDHG